MYQSASDRRLKENIQETNFGLSTLLQIPVRDYNYITDAAHARQQGFIAQELYKIYPTAVSTK